MSFILDALRKSEIERQQESGREFSSVPTGRSEKKTPLWLWVVIGLLGVNLLVLIGLLWRADSPVTELPKDAAVTRTQAGPEIAVATVPTSTATPTFADQVAAAKREPLDNQSAPISSAPVKATAVRAELIAADPNVQTTTVYPTLHAVIASGAIQLPALHLDIHVFSETPSDRFVFINMSKYREGSQLEEGPVVHEITPDGVVLGHSGQFFLLPRD